MAYIELGRSIGRYTQPSEAGLFSDEGAEHIELGVPGPANGHSHTTIGTASEIS